jgi:adenylate cyclase
MASIWIELKRRNVVKVAIAYAIVGWLLIEISSVLLPAFEAPDWILRVIILLVGIGFVLALILSWAFELTSQGVVRTEDVPESESVTKVTGQKLNTVIIAALVLVLGLVVVDSYVLDEPEQEIVARDVVPPAEETAGVLPNSVAVLLCDNLSPNPDDAYFAASIHEEILNQLVKISSLNVIARTSVLQYAEAPLPIPQVAAELNVGAVMECSVRFSGTAILVTAQLIDPVTNSHLWSDTYPGDLSDLSAVFAMQADIAMNIANALQAEFSSAEQERLGRQTTISAEAYTLYLRALSLNNGAEFAQQLSLLSKAIEQDPEFALAYAYKARVIASAMRFGVGRTAENEQLVIDMAEKALSMDPTMASAQLALAVIHELNWRRVDAEIAYESALELYPNNPEVAIMYGAFKRSAGEYPEAIRLCQIAVKLDPKFNVLWHQLGVTYLHARNYDAAYGALKNSLALAPDSLGSNLELGNLYLARGDLAAARKTLLTLYQVALNTSAPVIPAWLALSYERAGLQEEAERAFGRVEELVGDNPDGSASLAIAYVAVREYDKAYEELERAISGPTPLVITAAIELKINRWNHPALDEPRFVALRDKLGFQD